MGEEHPIESLMLTAMNSIKDMIDVNTIIGEPIQALNNTVIIPISKVGFGFAAGGSEFNDETVNSYNRKEKEENIKYRLPFGGGSGAGVNITPVAFLIVQNDTVKLLEATHTSVLDKLVEYVPDVIDKINQLFNKKSDDKTEKSYIDFDEESDKINWNKNENIQDDMENEIEEIFSQDKKINKSNKNLEDKINEIKRENNNSKE
ncbi:MAG: GerW family sporulation protein [Clostridia bacterium]|nr:GerW family sporulation protein [Clostridia bacterium]